MYNLNVFIVFFSLSTISLGNKVVKTKSYCEFNEEIFSYSYNLTKLSKPGEDIVIHYNSDEIIRMQLCSPLIKKCNGKDGYSICLEKNNTEIGIGKVIPELLVKSGKIHFTFNGDKCQPGINYTVDILIMCDYSINGYSIPTIFEQKNKCQFHMIWSNAFACAKRKEINCTVTDPSDGSHYDLSVLKRYSDNYDIYAGNNTSVNLILNVCHSVIFGYNVLCPMNSGACLRDPQKEPTLRYLNLGNVQKPLTIDPLKKNLILEYDDGSICKNEQQKGHHIRTTITFICNLEAKESSPEVTETDGCHYQLKWITAAACSLKLLREYSAKTAGKCTINNPITNFTYDLQSLMNKDFNVISSQGAKYTFRICGAVTDNKCKEKTGVCLKENGTSLGMANTNLMWQQGGPYLNYTDGDKCSDNQYRQTLIAFLCGPEGSTNDPIIIKESPCQLIVHWNLDLVCEKKMKCATIDNEINLAPLIRATSNYIVKVNNTVFYINVCQPIVNTSGLKCVHGSAICKASLNANNELVKEVNLGFPKKAPENDKDQIVLRYLEGSACPERADTKISSVFLFVCGNKNKGLPEFKNYSNCTYTFEWKTNIVCGAVMGDWIPPCMIKDRFLLNQFDLSLLYTKQPIHYVKSKEKNYGINICGKQKNCNGSTVCQESNSYGSLSNVIFEYNQNYIKLEYLNGSKCSNSSYMSEIKFICNESSEIGEPKLTWESQCRAEFEWYTNVTCIHRSNMESKLIADKQKNIQSSSSHAGLIAGIVITICMFLLALFYYRNPNKRAFFYYCFHYCFQSCFHYCNSRKGSGLVQYCRVGTTEQAHLLLDPNNDPTQCQSDSDDDILDA